MATAELNKATGRRKTATVSVEITKGKGEVKVNGRDLNEYFSTAAMRETAIAALTTLNIHLEVNVAARARGGGLNGQAGAMRHAIARALSKESPDYRAKLKSLGYLTRDPRAKERKKTGQPGARKRFQFSKR